MTSSTTVEFCSGDECVNRVNGESDQCCLINFDVTRVYCSEKCATGAGESDMYVVKQAAIEELREQKTKYVKQYAAKLSKHVPQQNVPSIKRDMKRFSIARPQRTSSRIRRRDVTIEKHATIKVEEAPAEQPPKKQQKASQTEDSNGGQPSDAQIIAIVSKAVGTVRDEARLVVSNDSMSSYDAIRKHMDAVESAAQRIGCEPIAREYAEAAYAVRRAATTDKLQNYVRVGETVRTLVDAFEQLGDETRDPLAPIKQHEMREAMLLPLKASHTTQLSTTELASHFGTSRETLVICQGAFELSRIFDASQWQELQLHARMTADLRRILRTSATHARLQLATEAAWRGFQESKKKKMDEPMSREAEQN